MSDEDDIDQRWRDLGRRLRKIDPRLAEYMLALLVLTMPEQEKEWLQ